MKATTKSLLIAALALTAATPALANHGHGEGSVYERLGRQQQRIEQGIDSGALTRWEVRKLEKQQRNIRHLAHELKEDGGLSRRDRRVLNEKLNLASDRIYRFKHNDEYRHRNHRIHRYEIDGDGEVPRRYGYAW